MKTTLGICLFAAVALVSTTSLEAQTLHWWVYDTNAGIGAPPLFDSGAVACPGAGCIGAFNATGANGWTISGSVQGLGLPNGRRARVFGATMTRTSSVLPGAVADVVLCYSNFNVVAPNIFNSVLTGTFTNVMGGLAEIQWTPDRNACDSRAFPYRYTTSTDSNPHNGLAFFQALSDGPFGDQVVELGETIRMVVDLNGDTVNIATTSADVEADTVASSPGTNHATAPGLTTGGLAILLCSLAGLGLWRLRRHVGA